MRSAAKAIEPGVAAEFGEARKRRALERKALRLLVGDHLQAMFDSPQERIGLAQVVDRLRADPLVGAKPLEHVERARPAHLQTAAAENELLRLDEKLDLADAASPELDVVAGYDDLLVAAHGVDLALHGVDVGDRRIVEILAPDERREVGEKTIAQRKVARRGPGLDERGALPVLADRLVIGDRRWRVESATGVEAGSGLRRKSTLST